MRTRTASQLWNELGTEASRFIDRAERYCELTIPHLLLPDGANPNDENPNDNQSFGAQCVNHIVNKMMLAMYAPSRPAFRMELGKVAARKAAAGGVDAQPILARAEREAIRVLDKLAVRPKLYTALRHLVVTGNVALYFEGANIRVMSLKYYRVKRNISGALHTAVIKESIRADELEPAVKDALANKVQDESKVDYYRVIELQPGNRYKISQWVNQEPLPEAFTSVMPAEDLPYHFLAWSLADEADYGRGMVEEYSKDWEAYSAVAGGVVDGSVLACESRWVVDPAGGTQVSDVNNSKNGDAIPGRPADIQAIQLGSTQAVANALQVAQHWEQRLARAFLMQSAVTRNAERVTAEEIRLTAQELESALGGTYSHLAVSFQRPVAKWLLLQSDFDIKAADIELVIITGLDALSRNGDLDNLARAMQLLSGLAATPQALQQRLKWNSLAQFVGDGTGVDLRPFLMSDEEYGQQIADQAQARVMEQGATAQATQPQGPQ